jgi:hypothetical protein
MPPLQAVRNCVLKLVERYETKESIIIDRLLRSTEALRVRKQALFVEMEQALCAGSVSLAPPSCRTAHIAFFHIQTILLSSERSPPCHSASACHYVLWPLPW